MTKTNEKKNETKTQNEILVFEDSLSDDVIFRCSTKAELDSYCELHDWELDADQISINGMIMYGWDEIEAIKLEN